LLPPLLLLALSPFAQALCSQASHSLEPAAIAIAPGHGSGSGSGHGNSGQDGDFDDTGDQHQHRDGGGGAPPRDGGASQQGSDAGPRPPSSGARGDRALLGRALRRRFAGQGIFQVRPSVRPSVPPVHR